MNRRPHPHKPQETRALAEAQRQRLLRLHQQEVEDIGLLMGVDWGRRIAHRLLDRARLLTVSDLQAEDEIFNPNAMQMARNAGRRDAMWRFDDIVRKQFNDQWNTMRLEHREQGNDGYHNDH